MITYEQALSLVLEHAQPLGKEERPLEQLLGCVLAEPVTAPHDLPLFDNSAVDGFGVLLSDVRAASPDAPIMLKQAGTIQAGVAPTLTLEPGLTLKILTGAPVPAGVEAVVMQEFTATQASQVAVQRAAKPGDNIRRRGEEFQQGEVVLEANTLITPPVIGLLASLGYTSAWVYRRPKVAIVVTGNELIPPGQGLLHGQIYESNSYSLSATLQSMGCEPVVVRSVEDTLPAIRNAMEKALQQADVLITSGGVSVGEFDWVKEALGELGVQSQFWKVAIKPGKPVYFGTKNQKLIFGLPGNPVSVLMTFYLFARPALQKMQGLSPESAVPIKARLLKDLRKTPGRLDFVRGQLGQDAEGATVLPTQGQGSHMLSGLAQADCLIAFAQEENSLPVGSWVDVIPLTWRLN